MPRLSFERKIAMGASTQKLSYNGSTFRWNAHPIYGEATPEGLVGAEISGSSIAWLNPWTLVFQSCQTPTSESGGLCRVYTHDTRTGLTTQVSSSGADILYAAGDVWAARLSETGYRDSKGRTHANYSVAGVDDDGTVLVILNHATQKGLGYLLPNAVSASNVIVITYDTIENAEVAIRNGIVVYRANGVLNRYVIETEEFTITNIPFIFVQNDGDWLVGEHTQGLGVVVVEFGETEGFQVSTLSDNFAPDIRVAANGFITVATSTSRDEKPASSRRYFITQNEFRYSLYTDQNKTTAIVPGLGPTLNSSCHHITGEHHSDSDASSSDVLVVASDIITVRANTENNTGLGRTVTISSTDWFGTLGGKDLRAAWQFGLTAVVAATNASASEEVTVKNSSGNTYSSGRTSYGNSSVIIRSAPASSNTNPLWEVTWVANTTTYSRVTLNANLAPTTSIANTTLTFENQGILDINATSNVPITGHANQSNRYGYVVLQNPLTRGDWTVGKDVSPTCTTSRLVAWNDDLQKAFVVWNGTIDGPPRLALQYDSKDQETPRVVPARRIFALQKFLEIGQLDLEAGATPGLPTLISIPDYVQNVPYSSPADASTATSGSAATSDSAATSGSAATSDSLQTDTRVFRPYQTIPPTTKVLEAVNTKGGPMSGSDSGAETCHTDPFGNTYVPNNDARDAVIAVVNELLGREDFLAMAQDEDRRKMVPFAREVARLTGVGMNAVRGNGNDPSGDAIAILNPTGGKGFGSWDSDKRVQIMDIVVGAHGGPGSRPSAGWIDVTSVCADDPGGGYINP